MIVLLSDGAMGGLMQGLSSVSVQDAMGHVVEATGL